MTDDSKMEEDYQLVDCSDTMAGPQAPAILGTITHAKPFARVIKICSDPNPQPLADPNLIYSIGLDNMALDHPVPTQLSRFGMVQSRHRVGGPNFLPYGGDRMYRVQRYASEHTAVARALNLGRMFGLLYRAGLTPKDVKVYKSLLPNRQSWYGKETPTQEFLHCWVEEDKSRDDERWVGLADQIWEELCLNGMMGSNVNVVVSGECSWDATRFGGDHNEEVREEWSTIYPGLYTGGFEIMIPVNGTYVDQRVLTSTYESDWHDVGQPVLCVLMQEGSDFDAVAVGNWFWEIIKSSKVLRDHHLALELRYGRGETRGGW